MPEASDTQEILRQNLLDAGCRPDTVHTDLYDGGGKNAIPFDELEQFFQQYLKVTRRLARAQNFFEFLGNAPAGRKPAGALPHGVPPDT